MALKGSDLIAEKKMQLHHQLGMEREGAYGRSGPLGMEGVLFSGQKAFGFKHLKRRGVSLLHFTSVALEAQKLYFFVCL